MEKKLGNSQKEGKRYEAWRGTEESPNVCSMSEETEARKQGTPGGKL